MRTSNLLRMLSFIVCLTAVSFGTSNCLADTAEVIANFDGGNSDTVVDAYAGMVGDGWSTAWKLPTPTNQTPTVTAVASGDPGYSELKTGSGTYMSYTATGSSASAGSSAVTRQYTDPVYGIDRTKPHTVEFTVRIDEDVSDAWTFIDYYDRYYLYDTPVVRNGSYSGCRWIVSAYGGTGAAAGAEVVKEWSFYDGLRDDAMTADRNIDTNIALTTGGVYDFTITVDPATASYDATVSDGTSSFTATDLGWRTSSTSAASGGYLGFNMRNSASDDTRAMSVDNIKISQDGWTPVGGMNQISSHFDGGNTDTIVDAFPGMAGNGWGDGWKRLAPDPVEVPGVSGETKVVSSGDAGFQELSPGEGPYLSHTLTTDATTTGRVQSTSARNYSNARPGIDFTLEHTISFKIRIDEDVDGAGTTFTDFDDRYYLFDSTSETIGPSAACTWLIGAYAGEGTYVGPEVVGEWSFFDGYNDGGSPLAENNVDTNMALTAGGVYEFTITVDPSTQTYDATVSDGTSSFTATDLGWRTSSQYVGGNLNFTAWALGGDETRAFSLDSIVVTQGVVGPVIPGDADRNGVVDAADAALLAANWQTQGGATWGMGDFNADGNVDDKDATILATNWQTAASASVPEPGTLGLLLLMGLTALCLRRRNG